MGKIYEVRAENDGRAHSFGARQTRGEAETLLVEARDRVERVGGHNQRYWIEEIDTTGLFEIPPRPTPRERYSTRVELRSPETAWPQVRVDILDGDQVIASYARNYRMLQTFEPFRQAGRDFALISPDYTGTSVIDLATGQIIAAERHDPVGFCPVGFYVPDWWDVHHGWTLPGTLHWTADREWPTGMFGFVWGCVWGDDQSWKVQYLDLSSIQNGILRRDDRFGYLELATHPKLEPWEFIRCWSDHGELRVEFSTPRTFDLTTGRSIDDLDRR